MARLMRILRGSRATGWATGLLLVLGWSGVAAAACGAPAVCGDVITSLAGQLGTEAITVTWSTDDETTGVAYYAIKRYDCGDPATCSVSVTTVQASGSCAVSEDYSYVDTPPSPLGSWRYTVEVWRADNTRACSVDTTPD